LSLQKEHSSRAPEAHSYNPSCLRGWDQEDHSSRPTWANSLQDQNNQRKMDWKCGLLYQAYYWFKPQSCHKKKKTKAHVVEHLPSKFNLQYH
jgi:hypothetical protein